MRNVTVFNCYTNSSRQTYLGSVLATSFEAAEIIAKQEFGVCVYLVMTF